eukprot:8424387-Alexandrium_andersonii.AAC.1
MGHHTARLRASPTPCQRGQPPLRRQSRPGADARRGARRRRDPGLPMALLADPRRGRHQDLARR